MILAWQSCTTVAAFTRGVWTQSTPTDDNVSGLARRRSEHSHSSRWPCCMRKRVPSVHHTGCPCSSGASRSANPPRSGASITSHVWPIGCSKGWYSDSEALLLLAEAAAAMLLAYRFACGGCNMLSRAPETSGAASGAPKRSPSHNELTCTCIVQVRECHAAAEVKSVNAKHRACCSVHDKL
jgi:hypothetical protein